MVDFEYSDEAVLNRYREWAHKNQIFVTKHQYAGRDRWSSWVEGANGEIARFKTASSELECYRKTAKMLLDGDIP